MPTERAIPGADEPWRDTEPLPHDDTHGLRYVVFNEKALGLIRDSAPYQFEILVSSGLKGGPNPLNGPFPIGASDTVRAATVADFNTFRLRADGYLKDLRRGDATPLRGDDDDDDDDEDGAAPNWTALDEQTKEDLSTWYNIHEEDLDADDKEKLAELYNEGRFEAWDCPECGTRVYRGSPESWYLFQGVRQVDYTSYPGRGEKYAPEYLERMCNHCRMHK